MRGLIVLIFGIAATAQVRPDPAAWMVMGQGGSVRDTDGALQFTYEVRPKQFSVAMLPAPAAVARMKRLRFRVKPDHDTGLAVLLSEHKPGGANYVATFSAAGGAWQAVELTPADFSVSDGPNDPVDPDGKLDLDQVEGIGITDLAQLFSAQAENPEFPMMVSRANGAHTLQVADFEVLGESAAGSARPAMTIDRFDRGYLEWITPGGIKLKLAGADNPLHARALEASYEQTQGRYGLLVRRLSHLDLSKAAGVSFDIASRADATMIVSIELKNGRRFNQTIFPPGKSEVFHVKLNFSDFEGEGSLDAALLKSMALADVSAAEGGGGQANTLWIANVEGWAK
jgi:hypothetical protein